MGTWSHFPLEQLEKGLPLINEDVVIFNQKVHCRAADYTLPLGVLELEELLERVLWMFLLWREKGIICLI